MSRAPSIQTKMRLLSPDAFRQIARDMLRRGYAVRFQADGTSMAETIADGETVLAKPIAPAAARLGDVILCDLGPRLVAHRLVAKRRVMAHGTRTTMFYVRGDARGAGVDGIEGDRILGRIQAVERGGTFHAIGRIRPVRPGTIVALVRWGSAFWTGRFRFWPRPEIAR